MQYLENPEKMQLGNSSAIRRIFETAELLKNSWKITISQIAVMLGILNFKEIQTSRDLLVAIAENHGPDMFCRASCLYSIHHIIKTNFPKSQVKQREYLKNSFVIESLTEDPKQDKSQEIFDFMMMTFKKTGIRYESKDPKE